MKRKAKVTAEGAKRYGIPQDTIVKYKQLRNFPDIYMVDVVVLKNGETVGPLVSLTGKEAGATLLPNKKSSKI